MYTGICITSKSSFTIYVEDFLFSHTITSSHYLQQVQRYRPYFNLVFLPILLQLIQIKTSTWLLPSNLYTLCLHFLHSMSTTFHPNSSHFINTYRHNYRFNTLIGLLIIIPTHSFNTRKVVLGLIYFAFYNHS